MGPQTHLEPHTPDPPRSWALTVDGLELGGTGIGLQAEVLHPASIALTHVHKVYGLPLWSPEAKGQRRTPLLAHRSTQKQEGSRTSPMAARQPSPLTGAQHTQAPCAPRPPTLALSRL